MSLPAREQIERALRRIVGVEHARVCLSGSEIVEIHIAASPRSRAKSVMRDVRSYLAAALGIEVDHKRISIAVRKPGCGHASSAQGLQEEASGRRDERLRLAEKWEGKENHGAGMRLRLRSVQMFLEGATARAEVRLQAGKQEWTGCASGISASAFVPRLLVRATLDAAQMLFSGETRLADGDMATVRLGGTDVLAVEVLLLKGRSETRLIGAGRMDEDPLRGAVHAAMDALNRVIAKQSSPDWTVFRVEPEEVEQEREEALE